MWIVTAHHQWRKVCLHSCRLLFKVICLTYCKIIITVFFILTLLYSCLAFGSLFVTLRSPTINRTLFRTFFGINLVSCMFIFSSLLVKAEWSHHVHNYICHSELLVWPLNNRTCGKCRECSVKHYSCYNVITSMENLMFCT